MIDLNKFQKEVYNITNFLGYICNKKNTLKKIKEEYQEFKISKPVSPKLIEIAANIHHDDDFKSFFESTLKGTEADEIPDLILVPISYSEYSGYDVETLLMVKKRYNSLLEPKTI